MSESLLYSLEDISKAANFVIDRLKGFKMILFEGEMGAGKTTLIKNICQNLGVTDNVSSPTFSIVNEYLTRDNKTIYHFDFYRIKNVQESEDIGASEYFHSGALCFIEWPSKIKKIIASEHIFVILEAQGDNKRKLTISYGD